MPKFRLVIYRGGFYAAWQEDGRIRRTALRAKNRQVAEQALKAFEKDYEVANRPEIITVEFVWNGYRETLKGKPSFDTMGFEGRSILPSFGSIAADAVSADEDCKPYCDSRRAQGRKDWTIHTELGRLRSALLWAAKRGIIASAPYIFRPPAGPPRDLRLTREEARRFLDGCEMPHIRVFVILAMTTGARMGALLGLTWDRVDFERGLVDLNDPSRPRTKKRRALVRMNDTARAALSEARTGAITPFVVEWSGKPVATVKKGLQAAGRRSGLPWVTAHVFRHSSATWMAESGIPMAEIAQVLGHTDSRITERVYARFSPAYLARATGALEIDLVRECSGVHRNALKKR